MTDRRLILPGIGIKTGVAVVLSFTMVGAPFADEPLGLPTNVCFGDFCGDDQEDIWNRFQDADGLKLDLIPRLYTGICYHHSGTLDPHVPQYGGVLINKIHEELVFQGRFSFHIKKNPYKGLDINTAKELFIKTFKIDLYDNFAYAKAAESFAPFRYWFRQEKNTDDLLMVGFFGFDHTILCSLE